MIVEDTFLVGENMSMVEEPHVICGSFDEAFLANFEALPVEAGLVPVKKGEKTQANEVDCITGATISSEAIAEILSRSTQFWIPLVREHLDDFRRTG